MADPKFCVVADVEKYAGANCSAISKAEAYVLVYGVGAESLINAFCRYNFSDNYSTLNVDVKSILSQTQAKLIAIDVITYNLACFTTRTEAEDMINILRDAVLRNLSILRDKKVQDFINGA